MTTHLLREIIDSGIAGRASTGGAGSGAAGCSLRGYKELSEKNIIELKGVSKSFDGKNDVISDINLEIREGEFVTLLGPSGCGKTTILRMIGGFETPSSGEILLDGKDISVLPANLRPINTVFQNYALFPHLNVYENIAFGLRLAGVGKEEMDEKVKKVLEIVDLEGFEKRSINTLSGGQQQRIAIARAIVNEPKVLLLDESLSALDAKMRKEMQLELKNMHALLGITFIFVTHDQEEALTMSDKVVVLADGKVQQTGTPEDIYNEPANVFVADFIGESNIFNGVMMEDKKASFAGTVFQTVDDYPAGIRIDAVIRPEDVDVVKPQEGMLRGKVTVCDFIGTFYVMLVECGQYELEVHCFDQHQVGDEVGLSIDPDMIHIIKYDLTLNHFEGRILEYSGGRVKLEFGDAVIKLAVDKVFKGAVDKNGVPVDAGGKPIDWEKVKLDVSFEPDDAELSDEIEKGIITGKIFSFYYIGDHYSYMVRSASDTDYVVDDEYLWNKGDMVSVSVSMSKLKIKVVGSSDEE